MQKTDAEVEKEYRRAMGLDTVDVGSVALLRKHVNNQLVKKGGAKLKGYKPKRQLIAIDRNI